MKTGIYKITNLVNGKVYVGSAVKIENRWRKHKSDLTLNRHGSPKLQNSYNKHGVDRFNFEIVEECEKQNLIMREQFYIDLYDAANKGYNCYPIAGSSFGIKHSDEYKKKMSKRLMGVNVWSKNKKLSNQTKNKISVSLIGRVPWNKNKSMSNEQKSKISSSNSGRKSYNYNSTPILQYDLQDNLVKEWLDLISLKEVGFNSKHISNVCRNKNKTCNGFKWKFKQ